METQWASKSQNWWILAIKDLVASPTRCPPELNALQVGLGWKFGTGAPQVLETGTENMKTTRTKNSYDWHGFWMCKDEE